MLSEAFGRQIDNAIGQRLVLQGRRIIAQSGGISVASRPRAADSRRSESVSHLRRRAASRRHGRFDDANDACFIVRDHNGHALALFRE
jgi:hypothetical protein